MSKTIRYMMLACTAYGSLLAIQPHSGAYAQTTSNANPTLGGNQGLEEIVVTARRVEEKLQDVPVAVTALSTKELTERQIYGVEDIASSIPSVTILPEIGTPGQPQFAIRGVSAGTLNPEVDSSIALYVDGVYLGRNAGSTFDLADLERVEVLRGPQGTLFGRNAEGGAINMITKGPSGVFDGHLETTFGDYNLKRVKATIDTPEIDGLSFRLTVLHSQRDGYVKNSAAGTTLVLPAPFSTQVAAKTLGDDDQTAVNFAARYAGEKLTLDYKFDMTDEYTMASPDQVLAFDTGQFGSTIFALQPLVGGTNAYGTKPLNTIYSLNADDHFLIMGHSLTAQYDIEDDLTLKSISSYRSTRNDAALNTNEANQLIAPFAVPPALVAGELSCLLCSMAKRPEEQMSEEFQVIGKSDRLDWIGGIFLFDEKGFQNDVTYILQSFQKIGPNTFTAGPLTAADYGSGSLNRAENRSAAAYLHGTMHASDTIDVAAGVRFTYDHRYAGYWTGTDVATPGTESFNGGVGTFAKDFSHADYEVAVTYKLTPDVNFYGRVATGYVSGGVLHGAPYEPTTNTTYEAGMKSEWLDHTARVNLAIFEQDQVNLQVLEFRPVLGQFLVNGGNNHTYGVELESSLIPLKGVTLSANMGYDHYGISNDTRIPAPDLNVDLVEEYRLPEFEDGAYVSLRLDQVYTDAYSTQAIPLVNPAADAATFAVANWQLGARLTLANIPMGIGAGRVSIWGKNLSDQRPVSYAANFGLYIPGTFAPPRTFGIDLAVDFGGPSSGPEAAPAAYVPPPVVAPAASVSKSYLVFFDFNKSDLTADATTIVDQAAKNAGPAKVTQLTVTGHTDTVGSDAYNMRLSRRRAESVAAELEKDGIASSEIEIVAKGKHDLLVPTGDGVKEPQNRRVQIVYSGGATS